MRTELLSPRHWCVSPDDTKDHKKLILGAGGASLAAGEMELMLHRRVLHDDYRGVTEPLNETACGCTDCGCHGLVVKGTHHISLHVRPASASPHRALCMILAIAFCAVMRQCTDVMYLSPLQNKHYLRERIGQSWMPRIK